MTLGIPNRKDITRLLQKIIHQQIGKPRKVDKFLETYNLLRLDHKEIWSLNSPITSKIKSVSKNFSSKGSSGPDGFTGEFCQTVKEELIPILLKLFQVVEKDSFYEVGRTLMPKQGQHKKKKS